LETLCLLHKLEYPDFSGTGKMYKTDTISGYVDWLRITGEISDKLADTVTLD